MQWFPIVLSIKQNCLSQYNLFDLTYLLSTSQALFYIILVFAPVLQVNWSTIFHSATVSLHILILDLNCSFSPNLSLLLVKWKPFLTYTVSFMLDYSLDLLQGRLPVPGHSVLRSQETEFFSFIDRNHLNL